MFVYEIFDILKITWEPFIFIMIMLNLPSHLINDEMEYVIKSLFWGH